MNRRTFLRLAGVASATALAGCDQANTPRAGSTTAARASAGGDRARLILARDPEVVARELRRAIPRSGTEHRSLRAAAAEIDIGGRTVQTWAYDGQLPGPILRAELGDTLAVRVSNELPEATTVHWHGLTLRNDMDGIHDRNQHAIEPGSTFPYSFVVDAPGTYWYHSHVGLQADRGLYGPLIVDDPRDIGRYDSEHIVMLDDWIDGVGPTPDEVYKLLHQPIDRSNPSPWIAKFRSDDLAGDAGSINYPLHLINGRPTTDRPTFSVQSGTRVRLRIINAAAETAYRFGVGGLQMTVVHTDGYEVEPVIVDALLIGPGERYDVTVDVSSGSWALIALPSGKPGRAEAILRTRDHALSSHDTPPEVAATLQSGRLLHYSDLKATPDTQLNFTRADSTHEISLTGSNARFHWGINGEAMGNNGAITVHQGERARLTITNTTSLWHPMHLHGHTFRLGTSRNGPRKDTVIVKPGDQFSFDVLCDNPGQWMLHCHNAYHFQSGMSIPFSYER